MLSRDPSFTEVIQGAASKLDIQLLEMDDILRYIDLVSQEPFDLVLLDCEGSPAGKHLLSTLRQISANREAVFMIAGAQDEASAISGLGSNVNLPKPLTPQMAQQHLRDAVQLMQERRRQYDRHTVEIDVLVTCDSKNWEVRAKSMALGEGGMGVQLPQRIDLGPEDAVRLAFQLPGTHDKFEIFANLAWIDNDMQAGFRFKPLTTSNAAKLSAWLNQHAPLPGGSRKEIVESWLAQHGSATDTVVISAGMRKQMLPEKKTPATPAGPAITEILPDAPKAQSTGSSTKSFWYMVVSFLVGLTAGFALSRIYHLF